MLLKRWCPCDYLWNWTVYTLSASFTFCILTMRMYINSVFTSCYQTVMIYTNGAFRYMLFLWLYILTEMLFLVAFLSVMMYINGVFCHILSLFWLYIPVEIRFLVLFIFVFCGACSEVLSAVFVFVIFTCVNIYNDRHTRKLSSLIFFNIFVHVCVRYTS